MKFNLDETVKINLKNVQNEMFNIWSDMVRMDGQVVKITETRSGNNGDRYMVEGSQRAWIEECFEPVEREVRRFAKVDEYVRILPVAGGFVSQYIGQVFKVSHADETDGYIRVITPFEKNTPVSNYEYVVVENYKPEQHDLSILDVFTKEELIMALFKKITD